MYLSNTATITIITTTTITKTDNNLINNIRKDIIYVQLQQLKLH